MSLYTSENMARAKSLATGWGILCGGVAVATESMLGFAWCMRVSKLLLGGWAHLGAVPPKGISHRLFARIAEHILREAFALRARPVYRRAPALLGDVAQAVDRHKLQVVGTARSRFISSHFSGTSMGVETNWMPMPSSVVASQMFSTAAPMPKME
jgi:hypothetical protein